MLLKSMDFFLSAAEIAFIMIAFLLISVVSTSKSTLLPSLRVA